MKINTITENNNTITLPNIKSYLPYIIMTISAIIGGTTWPLGKWMVTSYYGATVPQLIIIFTRYLIAIPILFLILYIKERSIHVDFALTHKKYLASIGFFIVTVFQMGYMYGETYTTGTEASLLIATIPIAVFIISVSFLKYKITLRHVMGLLTGFLGVLLVILFETSSSKEATNPTLGNFIIIIGVIGFALYTVILKEFNNSFSDTYIEPKLRPSTLTILTWFSLFGMFFLAPLTFLLNPSYLSIHAFVAIPSRIWLGIFYLGLLPSVLGVLFFVEAIKLLDPNRAVIFTNLIPIVGIALSALLLGEKINLLIQISSLVLIFISIYLVNTKTAHSSK